MHEMYSFFYKEIKKNYNANTLIDNYKKILISLIPIIPHLAYEAMDSLNQNKEINWPSYDETILIEKVIPFIIQVNGKKRGLINADRDITEVKLLEIIMNYPQINKYFENKNIKKKIFIKNKLVNIII